MGYFLFDKKKTFFSTITRVIKKSKYKKEVKK